MSKRRPYIEPMKATWWLSNSEYRFYILREATSIFVVCYSLFLLMALAALMKGEQHWNSYLAMMQTPGAIAFHLVCFAMVLLHSMTWFSLAPKTMKLRIKDQVIPESLIINAHYVAFGIFSLFLLVCIGGWI
jgi:fumarate reductase subunit C